MQRFPQGPVEITESGLSSVTAEIVFLGQCCQRWPLLATTPASVFLLVVLVLVIWDSDPNYQAPQAWEIQSGRKRLQVQLRLRPAQRAGSPSQPVGQPIPEAAPEPVQLSVVPLPEPLITKLMTKRLTAEALRPQAPRWDPQPSLRLPEPTTDRTRTIEPTAQIIARPDYQARQPAPHIPEEIPETPQLHIQPAAPNRSESTAIPQQPKAVPLPRKLLTQTRQGLRRQLQQEAGSVEVKLALPQQADHGAPFKPAVPLPTNPLPEFPTQAQLAGRVGMPKVQVIIGPDGRVRRVHLVKSSGHRDLDEAALRGLAQWRFEPAIRDGRPTTTKQIYPVNFHIPD